MSGQCIATINAHNGPIYCLTVHNGELYSASQDKEVKRWNMKGTLKEVFQGHDGSVNCVVVWNGALFSGSDDKTILQWTSKSQFGTIVLIVLRISTCTSHQRKGTKNQRGHFTSALP